MYQKFKALKKFIFSTFLSTEDDQGIIIQRRIRIKGGDEEDSPPLSFSEMFTLMYPKVKTHAYLFKWRFQRIRNKR